MSPDRRPPHRRRTILLAATSLLLLPLAALWLRHGSKEPLPELTTALRRSFSIDLHTVGVLDAARSQTISSSIRGNKGKIISIVEDGAWVKEGDVLIRLDPTPFEEEVNRLGSEVRKLASAVEAAEQLIAWEQNQLEGRIAAADFNRRLAALEVQRIAEGDGPLQLAQHQEEMEKARLEMLRHEAYRADLEALEGRGFPNPVELSRAKENADTFRDKFRSAERRHASYKDYVLPSLLEAARAKVQNAEKEMAQARKGGIFKVAGAMEEKNQVAIRLQGERLALQLAQEELEKTTIRAPIAGIVIQYEAFRDEQKRKPRVGDSVWQNYPLLYLPDIASLVVKSQVREVDLHKIAPGQKCGVQVDAYPETLLEGEVSTIGALAATRVEGGGGEKYFQMTVDLKGGDLRLRPGMSARVAIRSRAVKDALTVPIQAVFDEQGAKWVYLYSNGKFHKAAVTTGVLSEDWAEIKSGLEPEQQVALSRPEEIH